MLLDAGVSDDPADWAVDTSVRWVPHVSEPRFVVPGDGLPVTPQAAHNNVVITIAGGLTFIAWRTAPTHVASDQTEMHPVSSPTTRGRGPTRPPSRWGRDVREPAFLLTDGVLSLSFFEAGSDLFEFEPKAVWRAERCGAGEWTAEAISEGEKVPRNENGDATDQGSKVCTAPADDWGAWTCSDPSDPERHDSPEMIRHGDNLYLLARRDIGGPYGDDVGMAPYSTRPKRSALYRIDRDARKVVWVQDTPGPGDTAFVSARRTGGHSWLFTNYTSACVAVEPAARWPSAPGWR